MTYEEIAQAIEEIGIPFTYYQFNKAVKPPFICFYYPESRNFNADSRVYQKGVLIVIELYTDKKDFELEEKIEQMLDERELVYHKNEEYVDSEKLYQITYETEGFING